MIDVKDLIDQPEKYRASQEARGADASLVDLIVEADASRRASISRFEELRAEQKAFGKKVAKAQGEEKQALLAEDDPLKRLEMVMAFMEGELSVLQVEQIVRPLPDLARFGRLRQPLEQREPVPARAAGFRAVVWR